MRAAGVLILVAASVATTACSRPVRGNGQNLLLITIETTRADHLGAYGYGRDTSPRIDALAAEGVLFERVSSVSPRTNPSLASLMTSRYPHEHGVRNLLLPLEGESTTLAEVLRAAGYATAAVQTHPRLVASSGFDQGFQRYEDDWRSHPLAADACRVALDWIRRASRRERPWFLWVHLMDPHWEYYPPEGWRGSFGAEDPRPVALYRAIHERQRTIGSVIFENAMPPDEVGAFIDLYDAEIRYADHEIGRLVDALEAMGLRGKTAIALTADHGESLGEHHYFFEHGDFGTEPEIHVPLVLAAPALPGKGVRVPWTVDTLDVGPTLVELLGLPPEARFRGRSLVPLVAGEGGDRPCFGETGKRFHAQNRRREVAGVAGKWRWVREGRYKLVLVPRAGGAPERRLYDLEADPGETLDVSERHPDVARDLSRRIDAWVAEDAGEVEDPPISPEVREELRSLGYID